VISKKWSIAAVGGVLAAVALTGCAPKGSGANDQYGAGGQPDLAGATTTPSAAPTAAPSPPAPAVKLTDELKVVSIPKMGKVITDQNGWTLYRFDNDTTNPVKSNCEDKCAKVWPPALTDGQPKLDGVDPSLVGTVTRADGTMQITVGKWPLYRYLGDIKPGTWKGQNVGGKWFVSAPDGKKNLTCVPTPPPTAIAPPDDDASANSGSDQANTGNSNSNANSNSNSNSNSGYGSGGY
jgi:predicted lipoprotein with Yx(FWY)xxD motif